MVIEEIVWEGERGRTIRFGYYRKEKKEKPWRWGSQTTFHFQKWTTEKILRKAVAKGYLKNLTAKLTFPQRIRGLFRPV